MNEDTEQDYSQDQAAPAQYIGCPRCGTVNPMTNLYCGNCGAELPPAAAQPARKAKAKGTNRLAVVFFLIPVVASLSAVGQGYIQYRATQDELRNAYESTGVITDVGGTNMDIVYTKDTDNETYRNPEFSQIDYVVIDGDGGGQPVAIKEVTDDADDLHQVGDKVPVYYNGSVWRLGTIAEQYKGAILEMVIGAVVAAFNTFLLILVK